MDAVEEWLDALVEMPDEARWTALAYVAGQSVEIPEDELNEALRRALVVRAVGGDPTRELELGETAVTRLAEELDAEERRAQLQVALGELRVKLEGRPAVAHAADLLLADDELAWRCYAAALVAAEL
jgi:hypothetical protein